MKERNPASAALSGVGAAFGKAFVLLLRRFFVTFGMIILALSAIGLMQNSDYVMFCSQILWTALFALLIAFTFALTDFIAAKNVNAVIVRAIHFVLSYLFFVLTYVVGGAAATYLTKSAAGTNRAFMIICMTFLFIGVYAVVGVVRIGVRAAVRHHANNKAPYTGIYTDKNSNQ